MIEPLFHLARPGPCHPALCRLRLSVVPEGHNRGLIRLRGLQGMVRIQAQSLHEQWSTFLVAISWWGISEMGGRFIGGGPGFARILLAVEYTCRGSALYDIPSIPNIQPVPAAMCGRENIAPLRRTNPSDIGVALAMLFPISMISDVPFPAANLPVNKVNSLRCSIVQDGHTSSKLRYSRCKMRAL